MTTDRPSGLGVPSEPRPAPSAEGAWAMLTHAIEGQSYPYHVQTIAHYRPLIEAAIRSTTPPQPDLAAAQEAFMAFMGGVLTDYDAETRKRLLDRAEYYMTALAAVAGGGLDVERLTFEDLLSVGEALLEHYPPDTIVCSHSVKADIGAQTAAGIADVIASCRVALATPPQSPDGGS